MNDDQPLRDRVEIADRMPLADLLVALAAYSKDVPAGHEVVVTFQKLFITKSFLIETRRKVKPRGR